MKMLFLCGGMLFLCCDLHAQAVQRNAVVIHEFMADPTPSRGLPNSEYIELRNRSDQPIDLLNWRISNGSSSGRITARIILRPDSVVILCSASALSQFLPYGIAMALTPFPTLSNEGDTIMLLTPSGEVVHAIAWEKSWYGNTVKEDGGWSLEMRDISLPCLGKENWLASVSNTGGSPGRMNSLRGSSTDSVAPYAKWASMADSVTMMIVCSEPLGKPPLVSCEGNNFSSVTLLPPLFNTVKAVLQKPLTDDQVRWVTVKALQDCKGNSSHDQQLRYALPAADAGDQLVINELLFDPPPGGSDYIEIYNRGKGVVSANNILVTSRKRSSTKYRAAVFDLPVFPGDYLLLTPDTGWIRSYYNNKGKTLIQTELPTLPDDSGNVWLLDSKGKTYDEVSYSARWHHPLIASARGVALERIFADKATQDAANWHSASSLSGFGTPGLANSQSATGSLPAGRILRPNTRIISPDLDGRDDLLILNYSLDQPGYLANVSVHALNGSMVSRIANNALCGTEGYFRWDGMDEKGNRIKRGNYIIYAMFFTGSGKRLQEKMAIAIW